MSQIPAQGQFLIDRFNGEIVTSTFSNSNSDQTFVFKSDNDVCLKVVEDSFNNNIELRLVKLYFNSELNGRGTVKSESKTINYDDPKSDNIGDINRSKKEALNSVFNSGESLYNSWINKFGEESIKEKDN